MQRSVLDSKCILRRARVVTASSPTYRRVVAAVGAGVEPAPVPDGLKAKTLMRATPGGRRVTSPPHVARQPGWTWLQAAAVLVIAALGAYVFSLRSTVDVLSRRACIRNGARGGTSPGARDAAAAACAACFDGRCVRSARRRAGRSSRDEPGVNATARAYVSPNQGLVFTAAGLPVLPEGRVYQLWVIPPGATAPISAGLVPVDSSGDARITVELPQGLTSVGTVALTNEPGPAGSPGPTSAPLLAGTAGG